MITKSKRDECDCDSTPAIVKLMSVENAKRRMLDAISHCVDSEVLPLHSVLDRKTYETIRSLLPSPVFTNSAMDGFAVKCADLHGDGPWCLPVRDTIAAGEHNTDIAATDQNQAFRIFTGAPVPSGFDAVIKQEDCEYNDQMVCFHKKPFSGQNIRERSEDMETNTILIERGNQIRPQEVGLLAANGHHKINVFRKPRIAIFSTGDELVEPGKPLKHGQIYDTNRSLIRSFCLSLGADVVDWGIVPDNLAETEKIFNRCKDSYDLILSSGAVSVGDRDHVNAALQAAGGKVGFWRIAIKPGKPLLFGTLGETIFVGLPGNPLAVFVALHVFIKTMVEKIGGLSFPTTRHEEGIAEFSLTGSADRESYVPVTVVGRDADNRALLGQLSVGSSGSLAALMHADGLAIIPSGNRIVEPGQSFVFQRF